MNHKLTSRLLLITMYALAPLTAYAGDEDLEHQLAVVGPNDEPSNASTAATMPVPIPLAAGRQTTFRNTVLHEHGYDSTSGATHPAIAGGALSNVMAVATTPSTNNHGSLPQTRQPKDKGRASGSEVEVPQPRPYTTLDPPPPRSSDSSVEDMISRAHCPLRPPRRRRSSYGDLPVWSPEQPPGQPTLYNTAASSNTEPPPSRNHRSRPPVPPSPRPSGSGRARSGGGGGSDGGNKFDSRPSEMMANRTSGSGGNHKSRRQRYDDQDLPRGDIESALQSGNPVAIRDRRWRIINIGDEHWWYDGYRVLIACASSAIIGAIVAGAIIIPTAISVCNATHSDCDSASA